ncbi:prepilin-type N-terminal cleavage/methylation domain-containing protein [bacterium]|nr:prepilin-type N-terminal cleavage/methylation domain-containing protein [bacterium]
MKKIRGYTLTEVIIAVLLCSFVMGVIYRIWSQSRREISRSTTRQILQKEIRTIADMMVNDLKAVKAKSLKIETEEISGQQCVKKIGLEKFVEEKESTVARESVEKIVYEFAAPLLQRYAEMKDSSGAKLMKILSDKIEFVELGPGIPDEDKASNASIPGSEKKACLMLVLAGKMKVPGTAIEEFHIERTSVVMRDEFYQALNPAYRSNFDLAGISLESVIVSDKEFDHLFKPGAALTAENLKILSDKDLEGCKQTQTDNLKVICENIERVNKDISDGTPSGGFFSSSYDWIKSVVGAEQSFMGEAKDFGNALKGAKDIPTMKQTLDGFRSKLAKKEKEIIGKVYGECKNDIEKELVAKVLQAKIQDRQMWLMNAQNSGATNADLNILKMSKVRPKGETESQEEFEARQAKAEQFKEIYYKIDLRKIIAPENKNAGSELANNVKLGSESDDYRAFEGSSRLFSLSESKITLLESKQTTENNLKLINDEQGRRTSTK